MGFETSTAVYFLLRERPAASTPKTPTARAGETVTRLVRVCHGDRGSLQAIAKYYFGTMAKAEISCRSEINTPGRGRSHYAFTHVEAAHWDANTKRLYTTFTGGE